MNKFDGRPAAAGMLAAPARRKFGRLAAATLAAMAALAAAGAVTSAAAVVCQCRIVFIPFLR